MASVAKLKDLVDALVRCCGETGGDFLGRCIADLETFFGDADGGLLRKTLDSPVIPVEEKVAVLDELCRMRSFSGVVRNFLVTAAELGKLKSLSNRRRAVLDRLKSADGRVNASVTVAGGLSGADRERLKEAVARFARGAKSEVEFIEDSEIIGGMVVRIGNSIYDDSVRTRLDRMRSALSK